MRSIQPSRLLKLVLLADALVGTAMAAVQLLFTSPLTALLGLPRSLLLDSGVFLLAYVALLLIMATRPRLWSALVGVVVLGNIAWALACVGLMLGSILAPTGWGLAFLAMHATGVLGFAALEWLGWRRSASAGYPFNAQMPATR
jgi:hypothetical protein